MIEKYLIEHLIPYEKQVSLKKKTWIHRGGIAGFWIQPERMEQLLSLVQYFHHNHISFEIVGHTSNIYFRNESQPPVVISTLHLQRFTEEKNRIICSCGTKVRELANYCVEKGYQGYEGLVDLPGTIGAAVYNNSSCYGCSIASQLICFDYLDNNNQIHSYSADDMHYQKRSSELKNHPEKYKGGVLLTIYLKKEPLIDPSILKKKAEEYKRHRKLSQEGPVQNLGSIYGNLSYRNFSRFLAALLVLFCRAFRLDDVKKEMLLRSLFLTIFGKRVLKKYVSPKSIDCFVWADEQSDAFFEEYCCMMEKIYESPSLEIELK